MFSRFFIAVAVFLLAVWPSAAQVRPVEKPLTNSDIAGMVKAGLAESTIVLAIDLAASRGTAQFDTSPEALVALKNAGATAKVLDAMLGAAQMPKRPVPSTVVPGLPAEAGVYYQEGPQWVRLSSVLLMPELDTEWHGMTVVERSRYVLAGAHANLQIRATRPVFYVRGMETDRGWQLIKVTTKGEHRDWRTGPQEAFRVAGSRGPFAPDAVEIEYKVLAPDVFEIRPVADLQPAEYVLTAPLQGQSWAATAYDFSSAR